MIPFPPSVRIPIREGSKLKPPLGEGSHIPQRPEKRHMNFNWSIARIDALALALRTTKQSTSEIAENFRTTPEKVEQLARELGIVVRVRQVLP